MLLNVVSPVYIETKNLVDPVKVETIFLIQEMSTKYNVPYDDMYRTIECESGFKNVQSSLVDKNGKRERSFGVSQWNEPMKNTNHLGAVITREMSLSPRIAVEEMAYYFSTGRASYWSCYNQLYGQNSK